MVQYRRQLQAKSDFCTRSMAMIWFFDTVIQPTFSALKQTELASVRPCHKRVMTSYISYVDSFYYWKKVENIMSNVQFSNTHMWLVDLRDPKQLVQSWKLTFLKGLTLVITKSASKIFFTDVLFFKLRPRLRPWVKSENLVKQRKI